MKKFLAIVETADDVDGSLPISPLSITSVQPIPFIDANALTDPQTFFRHWVAGINARNDWENFSNSLFRMLIESGAVDESGLHVEEYTPGSVCRFVTKNQKDVFSDEFRNSAFGMMVIATIKAGGKMIKKGKEIDVNWSNVQDYARPMTDIVLSQMVRTDERAAIMMPIYQKYFLVEPDAGANLMLENQDNQ